MGRVNRRIGKSSETANVTADGTGGGVLDGFLQEYFNRSGNVYNAPGINPSGLVASGGVISDYTDPGPGNIYRAHVFTSSGTFNVTSIGGFGPNIEYLVVGGGGGAGEGGGGGGGLRTNLSGSPVDGGAYQVAVGPYTVTVGGGGRGGKQNSANNPGGSKGVQGGNSEFYPTPASYPGASFIRAVGGGGGGGYSSDLGSTGGSGGGGCSGPGPSAVPGLAGNTPTDPNHPEVQGYAGQNGGSGYGGGGGGASEAGGTDSNRSGGDGLQVLIGEPPARPGPTMTVGADGGYFAGGGMGGGSISGATGGTGGGGTGVQSGQGGNGTHGTGGGGGGAWTNGNQGGSGGSGIVVVRYQIASIASQKATGGLVSFYGGKTIHAFTQGGIFNVTSGPLNCEFFIVAGGGGGGFDAAGGGGGGGVVYHPGLTVANGPYAVTIGAGGRGSFAGPIRGTNGGDSSIAFPTTYTASGGGGGGSRQTSGGGDGGSGGGGGRLNGNGGSSAQPSSNPGATEYGNDGGDAGPHAAGGGGAGSAGQPWPDQPSEAGWGGTGIQAPTTFRNPDARYGGGIPSGDPTGLDWGFAGGGGGGGPANSNGSFGGSWTPSGRIPGGPYYGGGSGALDPPAPTLVSTAGVSNTGGGGGGGNNGNPAPQLPTAVGSNGGSGIVLVAYPT